MTRSCKWFLAKPKKSAAWVSASPPVWVGRTVGNRATQAQAGRAAAPQLRPTVAMWECRLSLASSACFSQKVRNQDFCMKSLHLKSCQLIQICKKHYVSQQMCRPNQVRVRAWAGPGPARLDILLYSENSLRILICLPLQMMRSQL